METRGIGCVRPERVSETACHTLISTWNGHKVTIKDGVWGGPMHLSKHYDKRLAAFVFCCLGMFLTFGYVGEHSLVHSIAFTPGGR